MCLVCSADDVQGIVAGEAGRVSWLPYHKYLYFNSYCPPQRRGYAREQTTLRLLNTLANMFIVPFERYVTGMIRHCQRN